MHNWKPVLSRHKMPKYEEFQIGQVFTDSKTPITSLDFNQSGDLLISSSGDDSLNVYDCLQGRFGPWCVL